LETSLIGKALVFGPKECGFEPRVSKLTPKYNMYAYVINHVNLLLSKRSGVAALLHTRKTIALVTALRAAGCIDKVLVVSRNTPRLRRQRRTIRFTVLLYKGSPFYKGVRLVSSPSRKHTISLKGLRLVTTALGCSTLLLSTTRGIVTHHQALAWGIGGLVLCVVS
jgi:ribosomal protein S8